MAEFRSRDPRLPAFWDERFEAGVTPWDAGGAPAAFMRFVAGGRVPAGAAVLIPGCGRAWEAAVLDAAGYRVRAIDFSAAAIARARAQLGARADRLLRQADFFEAIEAEAGRFDWIYERTFLPALVPARWSDWAGRVAQLTAPGAMLAGCFLIDPTVDDDNRRGPPFAIRADELGALLHARFECEQDDAIPATESIAVLAGRERWMTWRRR